MTKKFRFIAAMVVAVAIAAILALPKFVPSPVPDARAATPNVAISNPGVMLIPLQISGAYTTTTTVAKFNMPMPCDMLGVGATARGATGPSTTLDVQLGGVSILSALIALSTGTYAEGTISTAAITDEGVMTVIVNLPAAGTLTDTTVLMTCVRK